MGYSGRHSGKSEMGDITFSGDIDDHTKIDFEVDQINFVVNDATNLSIEPGGITIGDNSSDVHQVTGTLKVEGAAVFNEGSADKDFRVESNHNTHMFYIDGGTNRIGIGNNSPQTVLDITDPFDAITGHEADAIIRLRSKRDVGIKLIADTANTTGEADNPFIDYYSDSLTDATGRGNRLASMALEGTAGTTYTDSLAGAYFLDAFCPNHANSNLRPIQLANDSSNNGHKARITIEGTNGYVGIHTSTPSTDLEVIGTTKSDFFATDVTTQDLGSGTSSTLSTTSGIILLDADSINGSEMGGQEVHALNFPVATNSGQRLTIIAQNGSTNNTMILPAGLISGSYSQLTDAGGISALTFVWISEGSHKAWYQVK